MINEYSYKLSEMVNNLNAGKVVNEQIKSLKHTITNTNYASSAIEFYGGNAKWLVGLAEENISTIADLNNYVEWINK